MSEGLVQLRRPVVAQPVDPHAPRVYVETYGCQMNAADTDLIVGLFSGQGFARAETPDDADVILMNTCAVREKAEEKVFARASELKVHKVRRPGTVLAITGCMAEHLRGSLAERAPEVDVIAGPDSYRRLGDLVAQARAAAPPPGQPLIDCHLDKQETYEGLDAAPGGDGVSGFVTIQRGCDKFCTFCVVPFTRGRERGTPPREVLRQVRALADAGYKEVTLLGQTVNSYAWEDVTFAQLLRAVAQTPGLERVRFTSPYPVDFTPDVIQVMATEPRVCKHVHLPLQSASDAVLARMKRGYTIGEYRSLLAQLRAASPDLAVTTDVLVGFSGETEEDHAETMAFMKEARFDAAFMFAYSEREGTHAARKLPDDVPDAVKQRRLREIIALQEQIASEENARQVGRTFDVLLHKAARRGDGQLIGRTDNFRAVIVERGQLQPGQVVPVKIERSTQATLFGTVCGS